MGRIVGKGQGIPFGIAFAMAIGLGLTMSPARASSSVASSALDSVSTSIGLASEAISTSLSSVSPGKAKVAQGPYRIAAMQRPEGRAAWVWVDLEPLAAAADLEPSAWRLRLPTAVADTADLAVGQVLVVRAREYGLGIWPADGAQALYLVLHDEAAHALAARPLDGVSATERGALR